MEEAAGIPVESGASLANDCLCLKCGYNLRTLRLDGVCPECAQPIRTSLAGNLLERATLRELRSMRHGMVYWVLAILGTSVAQIAFLLTCLAAAPFWNDVLHRTGLFGWVYFLSGRAYSRSWVLAIPLQTAAIILVVSADPRARVRRKRHWIGIIVAAALAGAAGNVARNIVLSAPSVVSGPSTIWQFLSAAPTLFAFAALGAWLALLPRVGRGAQKTRILLGIGAVVLAIDLTTHFSSIVLALCGTWAVPVGPSVFAFPNPARWEVVIRYWNLLWQTEIRPPAGILLCLGLWACLRLVRAASEARH